METKTCNTCNKVLSIDNFDIVNKNIRNRKQKITRPINKNGKNRKIKNNDRPLTECYIKIYYRCSCKLCRKITNSNYYKNNKDKWIKTNK